MRARRTAGAGALRACPTQPLSIRSRSAAIVTSIPDGTAFAKTTRPELSNVVVRTGLFARLEGTPGRTVIWIAGPPGAGKSTLAASYVRTRSETSAWYQIDRDDEDVATFFHFLTHAVQRIRPGPLPVYDPAGTIGVAAFARRYFRELFAATTKPVTLVLDDLGELSPGAPLREAIDAALPQVPRHSCVIITSRRDPPSGMARLRANGQMAYVGAEDLKLSAEETAEMARLRGHAVNADSAARLQARTQGWAAATVLMLERAKATGDLDDMPDDASPGVLFDYLAGEIFDRFEPPTQQFLLRVACLPRMTPEVAGQLSGHDRAGRLLLNLAHNDYFVREVSGREGSLFQLHPLLRAFLLDRAAQVLPCAVDHAARARAASLLLEAGQSEDAMAILVEGGDWPRVAETAAALAGPLIAQGRSQTLLGWVELLPNDLLDRHPRLLLAAANGTLRTSPRTARRRFEASFAAFRSSGDTDGMVRSACGALASIVEEFDDLAALDRWCDELSALAGAPGSAAVDVIEPVLAAMLLRGGRHGAFAEWVRAAEAAGGAADLDLRRRMTSVRRAIAFLGGDFGLADAVAGGMGPAAAQTASDATAALVAGLQSLFDGRPEEAKSAALAGLDAAAAEASRSMAVWLRLLAAAAAILEGDGAHARDQLERLAGSELRRGDRALSHLVRGWVARRQGDPGEAQRELRASLVLAAEAGLPWIEWFARISLGELLCAAEDPQGAAAQVRAATQLGERLYGPLVAVSTALADALPALPSGGDAPAALRGGFARARALGLRHIVALDPANVASLCAAALRDGCETAFVRTVIRAGRLSPPPGAVRLKDWPWAYRISTLGGFALSRGETPVEFSTKGPGRPVELLKVLLACGGRNVRADQLADALWPHVDGAYAHKSFTQTLHRLRAYFDDEALVLRDGRLSLNPSLFWCDLWSVEQLLDEIARQLRTVDGGARGSASADRMEELHALYAGPFLPDEAEQPAYIACREQLRARLVRVVVRVTRGWEEAGRADAAADCLLRFIDADELCEPLYRNLMSCQQRSGSVAEGIETYERLRAVLAARLKTAPGPETQAVAASLRAAERRAS